jgi:hypothetical protein
MEFKVTLTDQQMEQLHIINEKTGGTGKDEEILNSVIIFGIDILSKTCNIIVPDQEN